MRRRHFLIGLGAALSAPKPALGGGSATANGKHAPPTLFIPGYDSGAALIDGRPMADDPALGRAIAADYVGPVTLLSRVELATGRTRRAAFPFQGHAVALAADGRLGVFASIRDHRMIAFDAQTLDLIAISEPFAPGDDDHGPFTGGGHSCFLPDGLVLSSERAPYRHYSGRPENHFGRLSVREPETLRLVAQFSSHGLHPHDLALLPDGKHVAVANYGSTRRRDAASKGPEVVEPSITVIELASGRLMDKYALPPQGAETRHLTTAGNDLFVVQVAKAGPDADVTWDRVSIVERDRLARDGEVYLPAPLMRLARDTGDVVTLGDGPIVAAMRHGLSILYDPVENQIIATFPGSHSLIAADAENGAITTWLRTDRLGLRYPCGLALHPDGKRYLVSGSFENIYVFDRASHRLDRAACLYLPLFRHSHMAVS